MKAITRPYDEDDYPEEMGLTRALLDVLALARELANEGRYLRTRTAAERLGISRNAAYKRIRRLRDMGLLRTQLMWVTGEDGGYPVRVPRRDGKRGVELRSWLVAWPAPAQQWGEADEIQGRFDPRTPKHPRARDKPKRDPKD